MRVATWNCAGAFRRKIERARALDADVTVIQEAEDPQRYRDEFDTEREFFWFAREQDRKGIAVFTRGGFTITPHRAWLPQAPFAHVIPLWLGTPSGRQVLLFAVWTLGTPSRQSAYVGQAHAALDHYRRLLRRPRAESERPPTPVVLAGDFNSNAYWDRDRRRNHSTLVRRLARRSIHSAYHESTGEVHGAESAPTFYLYRQAERPYHLDYCFTDLPVLGVEVGSYAQWSGLSSSGGVSDHVPVIATLKLPE